MVRGHRKDCRAKDVGLEQSVIERKGLANSIEVTGCQGLSCREGPARLECSLRLRDGAQQVPQHKHMETLSLTLRSDSGNPFLQCGWLTRVRVRPLVSILMFSREQNVPNVYGGLQGRA